VGVVVGVGGVPQEDNLILSVTVHITHAGIVGQVAVRLSRRCYPVFRHVEGDGNVACGTVSLQRIAAVLTASPYLVSGIAVERVLIHKEGAAVGQCFGGQ